MVALPLSDCEYNLLSHSQVEQALRGIPHISLPKLIPHNRLERWRSRAESLINVPDEEPKCITVKHDICHNISDGEREPDSHGTVVLAGYPCEYDTPCRFDLEDVDACRRGTDLGCEVHEGLRWIASIPEAVCSFKARREVSRNGSGRINRALASLRGPLRI
jgi:hypothetical protein